PVLVEQLDLELVLDALGPVDPLDGALGLALLAEAPDRAAEGYDAVGGRDGDRPVVDPRLPAELVLGVAAQLFIGHAAVPFRVVGWALIAFPGAAGKTAGRPPRYAARMAIARGDNGRGEVV